MYAILAIIVAVNIIIIFAVHYDASTPYTLCKYRRLGCIGTS
jgi:hypothetical protein